MPQTFLPWLAPGLLGALVAAWPADLAAPHLQRLAQGPRLRHAAGCEAGRAGGDARCRVAAPAADGSADDGFDEITVADGLAGCTPFLTIDGERELDFDTAHGAVVEIVTPSGPQRSGGPPPTARVGTFTTVDKTGLVVTVLAGVRREYSLIIPADGTQCILALGPPQAVNLERSWFGQVSDGADLDPPTYEHAAAPRLHGGREARRHEAQDARPVRTERLSRSSSL